MYRSNSSLLLHQRKAPHAPQAHLSNYQSGTTSQAVSRICSALLKSCFFCTDVNSCIFSLPFALSQLNTFPLCQHLFHICALFTDNSIAESQKIQSAHNSILPNFPEQAERALEHLGENKHSFRISPKDLKAKSGKE